MSKNFSIYYVDIQFILIEKKGLTLELFQSIPINTVRTPRQSFITPYLVP